MGSLTKLQRLRPRREILRLQRVGKRIREAGLVMIVAPRNGQTSTRYAVSTRKMKGAVRRNLLRRRLRAVLRVEGMTPKGYYVLLIAEEKVLECSWQELIDRMKNVFTRIPSTDYEKAPETDKS